MSSLRCPWFITPKTNWCEQGCFVALYMDCAVLGCKILREQLRKTNSIQTNRDQKCYWNVIRFSFSESSSSLTLSKTDHLPSEHLFWMGLQPALPRAPREWQLLCFPQCDHLMWMALTHRDTSGVRAETATSETYRFFINVFFFLKRPNSFIRGLTPRKAHRQS